ncbi:MAG: ATP-binding cassette domain-containing protein [Actinomycetota bacterium]|nr:ATP-binding cassette domain-containing protein [Actinomycetota bacterium]
MAEQTGAPSVFALNGVGVRRAGAELLVDITATIDAGNCTALVGPSGAGKSTLLRLLNRFDEPTSGRIDFHGRPLDALDVLDLRRRVGLVAQRPTLLAETVRAELHVAQATLTDDEAGELLTRTGLDAGFLDRASDTLSGGEAQRVCLARALTVSPEVLLLDEPTSSLDAESAYAVEQTIGKLAGEGLTVVLVSHDAGQAKRLADHVLVLSAGRLVEAGEVHSVSYLRRQR